MSAVKAIYDMIGLNRKIGDRNLRMLYLREVWGLPQTSIGEVENVSQSNVSRSLQYAKRMFGTDIHSKVPIEITMEELKQLQNLPREIISDVQLIAFIENIMGYEINHPFYKMFGVNINLRVAALGSMGIQQDTIAKAFHKTQPAVSALIKRYKERSLAVQSMGRYDNHAQLQVVRRTVR